MINRIVAVGKLKKGFWKEGIEEYTRRLTPYTRIEIVEVPEEHAPPKARPAKMAQIMALEGSSIQKHLRRFDSAQVVVLDRVGKEMDSPELAGWMENRILEGRGEINWVIGGPFGLAPEVVERGDLVLSLSRMTFTHEMSRLFLLEQIYRSFKIIKGEPYHK